MLKGLVVLVGIVSLFLYPGHIVLMIRREKVNSGKPMFGKEPARMLDRWSDERK